MSDGTAFVSFDIGADATDIQYFVQIGNKGHLVACRC